MDGPVRKLYQEASYGKTDLETIVTPRCYRMPQKASYYAVAGWDKISEDARALAGRDYDLSSYQRFGYLFPSLRNYHNSVVTISGKSKTGRSEFWMNNPTLTTSYVTHELGHTYGLHHAKLWKSNDCNPVSANGKTVDYEDKKDVMGWGDDPNENFNVYFKLCLGWITESQVSTVTTDGTYRIFRHDHPDATGNLALRIVHGARTYWIDYRNSIENAAAHVYWAGRIDYAMTELIDNVPNSPDSALAMNKTLTDGNLKITTAGAGGAFPNEYIDVKIDFSEGALSAPQSLRVLPNR